MPNRVSLISLCLSVSLGFGGIAQPAFGQALVPHTVQLNSKKLSQQGLLLAREAARLAQLQQYDLAIARARLSTQMAPGAYQPWLLLGGLHLQLGEVNDGVKALEKARNLESKNASILFTLGSAYFQQKRYTASVRELEAGLRIEPDVPEALFDLGNAYFMLGKGNEAIAHYRQAVKENKEFWPAINNIGLVLYEMGKVEDAKKQWEAAVEVDEDAAEPWLAIAVATYIKGDEQRGIRLAEKALKIDRRYSNLEFLKENLWGEKLLEDAKTLLETPRLRDNFSVGEGEPS